MSSTEYTLRRIAELLESGKYKKSHDMIVYLFQVWLEKIGIPKDRLIVRDIVKVNVKDKEEELEVDIAIKKDGQFPVIFEIIEPDPNWSLENPEVLKRLEFMIIRVFAYLLKPKRLFLTDGRLLLVYDEKCSLIEKLDMLSLDIKKEEELRNTVISLCR